MDVSIESRYNLEECVEWISENDFSRVVLQFKNSDLKHSVNVVGQLKLRYNQLTKSHDTRKSKTLDLYVTQSNTCCVDLVVTQHISNVDAIIHFGNVCLSKPHIENEETTKPVLFAFNFIHEDRSFIESKVEEMIQVICKTCTSNSTYILYDPDLSAYAKCLQEKLSLMDNVNHLEVARLRLRDTNWSTTYSNRVLFSDLTLNDNQIGQYILSKPLDHYQSAVYLGNRLSLHLTLNGPNDQWQMKIPESFELVKVNVSRALNKRIALVHRLQDEEELKVGVIITSPLPDITKIMDELWVYARARKHTLYFISMIQTIDECKIGNFDLCDVFLIINSCTCSTILECLVFNRPILNDLEFKLACGFGTEYGRVMWPGSKAHSSDDDLINKRKVSDVSLALVHTRNEMLERCLQARINKWSGLAYKITSDPDEGDRTGSDDGCDNGSLAIKDGLQGIASTYKSEPLQKSSEDNQSSAVGSQGK